MQFFKLSSIKTALSGLTFNSFNAAKYIFLFGFVTPITEDITNDEKYESNSAWINTSFKEGHASETTASLYFQKA
jgi:hypothetical protein